MQDRKYFFPLRVLRGADGRDIRTDPVRCGRNVCVSFRQTYGVDCVTQVPKAKPLVGRVSTDIPLGDNNFQPLSPSSEWAAVCW